MEVLQWIYTDQAPLAQGDDFVLEVMRTADRFKLDHLKTKYVRTWRRWFCFCCGEH